MTVTDANGCTDTETVTITQPTMLVASSIVDSNASCNGFADGGASASATGGTGSYTYTWSNAATTASITGVLAGTYSVTVTDANGCTDSASVVITEPATLIATSIVDSNVSCNGYSDGGATASATGGTMAYTYTWSNAATTASITGVLAGTYSVTITDANGCTDSASVTISEPASLIASGSVDNNVSCNAGSNGAATASATGGTTAYTYSWSNAATTSSVTGLTAGTYSVTITDANGCTDSASVTITQPIQLVSSTVIDSNVSCNGFSNGGATASATGGTTAYTYTWNNGATTASITGVLAGTYSVTITDANGCTDSSSVTITEPTELVASSIVDSNASCNGFADGGASASATGGTGSYTYTWSNAATTASITGVLAGTYSVTVTDANGCTDSASVVITEPATLIATSIVDSNVSCNGYSDGGATASATGGTMAYTYTWSNAATTASITGVLAGTYSVTITDANGCTDSASVTISEPASLIASGSVDNNVSCNAGSNGAATASATGGTTAYTYSWSNAATTSSVTGLTAGTYSVTITDANGCTDSASVTITQPIQLVSSTVIDSNVSCNGFSNGGATASATGGTTAYTYTWNNGATTASITGVLAGTYSVTITDANGCMDSTIVAISEPDSALYIMEDSSINISCFGLTDGSITVHGAYGTSPYTYLWSNGDTTTINSGLAAGAYGLTITDANGCIDTTTLSISEPDSISNSFTISNVNCNGGSNAYMIANPIGGTSPFSYVWSNAATTDSIGGLTVGTYMVTITDTNGCMNVFTDSISQPDSLFASILLEDSALCAGDSSGIAVAGAIGGTAGYTYFWPTGFSANNDTLSGLPAGTYMVTVVDANGCMDSALATINQPVVLALNIDSLENVVCAGGSDGYASINATGGTSPYDYAWPNGGTAASNSTLVAGNHIVTVTDANGCLDTITVVIGESFALPVVDLGPDTIVCGAVYNIGAGAASAYVWSTGATTQSIAVSTSGYYAVTAADTNGCANNDSVLIIFNPLLSYSISTDSSDCGLTNGSATISNITGGGNYSINWSTGQIGGSSAFGLGAGNYSVNITDQNGCSETQYFTVNAITDLVVSATGMDALCNASTNGMAYAQAAGGQSPYNYTWSNGNLTDTASSLGAGVYYVTVEDVNGCEAYDTAIVAEPAAIAITVDALDSDCGDSTGLAIVTAITPPSLYAYQWNDYLSQTTDTAAALPAGVYTVTVTDTNSCVGSAYAIVSNNGAASLALSAINTTCENGATGSAIVSASGTSPFTYAWSDENAQTNDTASNLTNGLYFVTVTDSNLCITIDTISVGFDIAAPAIELGAPIEACANSITLSVDTGYASYLWTTLATTSSISVTASNTYGVVVTNASGCVSTDSVAVTLNTPVTASYAITDADCGSSNGAIATTVLSGAGSYSYNWSSGQTTANISGIASGMYMITISDTIGCDLIDTVMVGAIGAPTVSITTVDPICFNEASGTAAATVSGGVSPYVYDWSNGGNGTTVSGLAAGSYSLSVTDNNGCEVVTPFSILSANPIIITTNIQAPSCSDSNGSITATVTGNQGPATYLWDDMNGTDSLFVDSLWAGIYTLTVTDSAGCIATEAVTLNDAGSAILITGAVDNNCSNEEAGSAFVIPFGNGPFNFTWNDASAQVNDTAINLGSGTYVVSVVDVNGCTSIGSTTIGSFNIAPVVSLGADITACNGSEVILTPGGQYASYFWTTGATTPSLTATLNQAYDVQVTDFNGCAGSDTALVTFVAPPVVNLGLDTLVCTDDGAASLVLDAGTGFTNYAWSTTETTQSIEITSGGVYSVTVSAVPECVGSDQIIVVFDDCIHVSSEEIEGMVEPSISIYPNPNRGQFIIEAEGLEAGNYQIQLMSINGQIVSNQQISIQSGVTSRNEMDLTNASKGVYILIIKGDKIRMDSRVIIQ